MLWFFSSESDQQKFFFKPILVKSKVLLAFYWNESFKASQTGQKKAGQYFISVNVSYFSLVPSVARVFFHLNAKFWGQ